MQKAAALVVPGNLDSRTGGYIYDRHIVDGLRAKGWSVDVVSLDETFPRPTASAIAQAEEAFARLPAGTVTVVDGSRAQSDAFEVRARRPVLVSGVVLHALPPGYRFDLGARVLLPRLQSVATPRRQARQEVTEEWPAGRPGRRRRGRGGEEQEASQ